MAQIVARAGALHRHATDRVLGFDIGGWVSLELGAAAGAAEMIGLAAMLQRRLAGGWIDRHAADGIAHDRRGQSACGGWLMIVFVLVQSG